MACGEEAWIFYNTTKFSGKKLVESARQVYTSVDRGVYSLLVLRGTGRYGGHRVAGGQPGQDELLVSHERAIRPLEIENTGDDDLVIIKFFGPEVNPDVPFVRRRTA
jgi:hypothetical protein